MSSSKEKFRNLIRYLRKHVQDSDKEDIDNMYDLVKEYRMDVYFDKKSWLLLNKFYLDDGSKIELTNDEMDAISVILFYEIDLMQTDNEIEVKKESKKSKENIWHFNSDLAEYLPNGEIKRLQTMINHFNEEGLKIFEKTHETLDIIPALREKCSYTKEEYETLFIYKFDNGTEIELTEYDIEAIARVIADEF